MRSRVTSHWRRISDEVSAGVISGILAGVVLAIFTALVWPRAQDTPSELADAVPSPLHSESPTAASPLRMTGQFEDGNILRASADGGSSFDDSISADLRSRVVVRMRISNPGPDTVVSPHLSIKPVGRVPYAFVTYEAKVEAANANPGSVVDEVTIAVRGGQAACPVYEPQSTELWRTSGSGRRGMPDGITTTGIDLPDLEPALEQTMLVSFKFLLADSSQCQHA